MQTGQHMWQGIKHKKDLILANKQAPLESYLLYKMSNKPRKTQHSRDQVADSTTEVLILKMSSSKQNPLTSQTHIPLLVSFKPNKGAHNFPVRN